MIYLGSIEEQEQIIFCFFADKPMNMELEIKKMRSSLDEVVHYHLGSDTDPIDMNGLLGSRIRFTFNGKVRCQACREEKKKLFAQGFCYNCFQTAPQASPCIIRPELCEGHLGIGRDVDWEERNHVQPHIVYLAISGGLKVGVTRQDQVPVRWIDQGASYAIKVAVTPYRKLAGEIEVALKGTFSDKTNWRAMLKNEIPDFDLEEEKWKIEEILPRDLVDYMIEDDVVTPIHYPVMEYPKKVVSLSWDKTPEISGTLMGIKGQYLIFEGGRVLNLRKHSGYFVDMELIDGV